MDNERELLELAAKAAGYTIRFASDGVAFRMDDDWKGEWNPLTDDGDSRRLQVKLRLSVIFDGADSVIVGGYKVTALDLNAATRLAVLQAAAAIARQSDREVKHG